jgi:hypothetical protein
MSIPEMNRGICFVSEFGHIIVYCVTSRNGRRGVYRYYFIEKLLTRFKSITALCNQRDHVYCNNTIVPYRRNESYKFLTTILLYLNAGW